MKFLAFLKSWLLWAIIVAAIGGGYFYRFRQHTLERRRHEFREYAVKRGTLKIDVVATGTVQPENRLTIRPPINGRIEEIRVAEGSKVAKNQILALMSSTDRAALLDVARSRGADELAHWQDVYKPTPLLAPLSGVIISRSVEPGQTLSTSDTAFVMSDHLIVVAQVDETDMSRITLKQDVG